jgi:hypothetical protein
VRYGRETVPERVRVQREGVHLQAQGKWSAGEGDGKQRFLADLRALRDGAALEFDELAARTHYPSDVLKEAESGPALPTLPILAAYVRACDGDVPEWEERWRRIGFDSRADDGLPVRPAGASPAAVAGARAGVSVAPPDAYDPDRIRAALRGSHGPGVAPVGAAPAESPVPESPASWSGGASWDETTRWDAAQSAEATTGWGTDAGWGSGFQPAAGDSWDGATTDLSTVSGNGNHHDDTSSSGTVIETQDVARADAIQRDPFSTDWLRDTELTSPPGAESGWPDQTEAEPPEAAEDSWFTPHETADSQPDWPVSEAESSPAGADGWFTPRERADDDVASPPPAERDVASPAPVERDIAPLRVAEDHTVPRASWSSAAASADAPTITGFWVPSAASCVPAEVQRPDPPAADDYAGPSTSWAAPAEIPASDPPDAMDRTTPVPALASSAAASSSASAAAGPSRMMAGSAVRTGSAGPVVPPRQRRSDRYYPVRLLVIIVVAALIGSILVLILR